MTNTFLSAGIKVSPTSAIFRSCESAFHLIKVGKDKEAKEKFPLEYYLLKKYFYLNMDVFKMQMENKLLMK